MRLLRALPLLVVALLLSACGNIHPGAAAVVDGKSISMKTLDDSARLYCIVNLTTAQQQGVKAIDNAEARRQAASDLVMGRIVDDIVKQRGLSIDRSLSDLASEQIAQINKTFGDDGEAVTALIKRSQELYAGLVAIGSDETGQTANADILDPLAQAGQQVVMAAYPDHDVTFSPRLGLSKDGQSNKSIGSLSVEFPDLERPQSSDATGPVGCSA